jgi:hypothetical protein
VYEDVNLIDMEATTAHDNEAQYMVSVSHRAGLTFAEGSTNNLKKANPLTFGPVGGVESNNSILTDADRGEDETGHYIDWTFANTYTFSRIIIEGGRSRPGSPTINGR